MKRSIIHLTSASIKIAAIVSFCVAIFGSCVTQRRCLEKFPPESTIEIRDSIAYRDTTIYFPVPADTIRDSIPVECPEIITGQPAPKPKPTKPITVENRWSKATAWIENGQLKLNLMINDTTLAIAIDSAVVEKMKLIHQTDQFVKPVKYIPKIYQFAFWAMCAVVFLGIVKFILLLRR
jgi:hypothetical protein